VHRGAFKKFCCVEVLFFEELPQDAEVIVESSPAHFDSKWEWEWRHEKK